MASKTRSLMLSLTIIAVILFSAFGTTRAYADDGGTTPEPPTGITVASEDANVDTAATSVPAEAATEEPSTSEATATEAPTTSEAPADTSTEAAATAEAASTEEAATPAPAEATAPAVEEAAPPADTPVLEAVPADTTVTVVDANGQVQPLATEAAAEAVATSDPIWCPSSDTTHLPGQNGCTESFTSFDALLNALATTTDPNTGLPLYQGAGTIYVQQGAYQGSGTVDFNAYNLSNISGNDLSITGGWNQATGATDPATPSTFNNQSIVIGSSANPWGGSLTLSNLTMNFTPAFAKDAANQTMDGLTLNTQGSINLVNVNVDIAPDDGADLTAGGDVNIVDSSFERSTTTGARIKAGRTVNVVNSSFSNPPNSRRQKTGLDIQSTGDVTLINVLANEDRLAGATISTSGIVSITGSFFSGTKHIQGQNFLGYGLQIVTPAAISLDTVTANDNFLWGASLDTCMADAATGACTGTGKIAISNSIFNANTTASPGFIDDTGLIVKSGGDVALNTVTASDNRLFGAVVDATGAVSVVDSVFSNNRGTITTGGTTTYHGHGLQVTSTGGIFLSRVTADNNMLFGAQLNSGGEVTVSASTFTNTSTGSAANALGVGLAITTTGNVFLSDVTLDNNQTVGARITAGGDVSLTGMIVTNNGTDGIIVNGVCVSTTGGTFSGNGGYGLNLLGTSALDLDPLTAFANNTAGNIFQTTPNVCALLTSIPAPTITGATTAATSSNMFVSLQTAPQQNASTTNNGIVPGTGAAGSANVTLKSVLSTSATGGLQLSIFTGQYVYVYSDAGIQIFAVAPSGNTVAMQGPFQAY